MRNLCSLFFLFICALVVNINHVNAQTIKEINWINFSQLNDSLKVKPKKVFIDFYADWCTYCKEMDKTTFKKDEVIDLLNREYYAVKMNVETRDTIVFGDQMFVNKRQHKINPIHEIAQLMAGRSDKPFSLPAYVVLDKDFVAQARYFQFLDDKALVNILSDSNKKYLGSK
ncbi:DUF255 domain-containing protein [Pedobacter changchengzhani]|uniref:DUF255 domain-containing protein n=1 Tax=Pedobacter changchengzhani TaxID=2529274 RepID=A0A4V3A027_9SPHI|nr:thioredoxin family protein [Pedobacter changchengzhani]TDG36013.1 DUF255 domain-containing protein [Pedobacter changchengzhani]